MAPDITKINKYFVIFAFLHGMTYSGKKFSFCTLVVSFTLISGICHLSFNDTVHRS